MSLASSQGAKEPAGSWGSERAATKVEVTLDAAAANPKGEASIEQPEVAAAQHPHDVGWARAHGKAWRKVTKDSQPELSSEPRVGPDGKVYVTWPDGFEWKVTHMLPEEVNAKDLPSLAGKKTLPKITKPTEQVVQEKGVLTVGIFKAELASQGKRGHIAKLKWLEPVKRKWCQKLQANPGTSMAAAGSLTDVGAYHMMASLVLALGDNPGDVNIADDLIPRLKAIRQTLHSSTHDWNASVMPSSVLQGIVEEALRLR
jgi:hypothetical protein